MPSNVFSPTFAKNATCAQKPSDTIFPPFSKKGINWKLEDCRHKKAIGKINPKVGH
jgi:hypothetical protein